MEARARIGDGDSAEFQPSSPPIVEGYEFQGISFSCYEIGGDYLRFIPRHDNKMMIALGDVRAKDSRRALMSSLHAAIHAQVAAKALWRKQSHP